MLYRLPPSPSIYLKVYLRRGLFFFPQIRACFSFVFFVCFFKPGSIDFAWQAQTHLPPPTSLEFTGKSQHTSQFLVDTSCKRSEGPSSPRRCWHSAPELSLKCLNIEVCFTDAAKIPELFFVCYLHRSFWAGGVMEAFYLEDDSQELQGRSILISFHLQLDTHPVNEWAATQL